MKQVSFFYFVLLLITGCEEPARHGCLDSQACNYDSDAMIHSSSCIYDSDCAGVCGGSAVLSGCDNACGSIAAIDCTGVCGGDATLEECSECESGIFDCSGACDGSAELDKCGECGGGGSSCDEGLWNVLYDVDVPISGFQFNIVGATVTGASGGAAAEAGFAISTGNNTVLGFSLQGATIPAGEGVLVVLDVTGNGEACLSPSSVVLSDPSGTALEVEITCNKISYLE